MHQRGAGCDQEMTERELIDEGYGLWYIVLEHTNHRFVNASGEPFIYDDVDAANEKAHNVSNTKFGKYVAMMVKDFNLRYKKHMEPPSGFEEVLRRKSSTYKLKR